MSNELFAYLAGILDGEGSIMIRKNTYRIRNPKYNDCKNPQYLPKISIKMNTDIVLKIFKEFFNGTLYKEKTIYQSKNGFKTNKFMYVYHVENKSAFILLERLLPFIRIKKEQTITVLNIKNLKQEYRNKREKNGKFQGQPYSKDLIEKLEHLWIKVKTLNGGEYLPSV